MKAPDPERRRFLLAAFGEAGHAFPMIALGRELAARGHDVCLQTWERWREHVEREGMRFDRAPEYAVFPSAPALKPYQAAVRAARETAPLVRELDPDAVVADILTLAAALAAQMEGRPWVTLVPHVLPAGEPGWPVYSTGARLPRTALGRRIWRLLDPLTAIGARQGREELNEARRRLGLPPQEHLHGGTSHELALIATFPQLEYPRERWESWMKVTGPLLWEQPFGDVEPPSGDEPLVLIAPSTSQDPEQRMLTAALAGLAGEPVRVLASTNRRPPGRAVAVPPNARLVDWVSYSRTLPLCDAVVCHAGHGTVARALACGVPLVACPAGGDMAENAARVSWAGAGVSLPRRLTTPRGVRLALRR
ncbi:MAG TPA: nucleotide disphospho-sugar-binding domain-containing protein, partial [Candidatus Limnocylindria bacterium]|nr:nucleotide disphospho-sugar-binding domain-containing protein [Candidatus Limnocylindria bacterium]